MIKALKNSRAFAGFLAIAIAALWLLFRSWEGFCLGPTGTGYLMRGETSNPLAFSCGIYDYSRFYP